MKEELWLIWKDPVSYEGYKVGSLVKENNKYIFRYVNPELNDAIKLGFKYFPGFEDLTKTYESEILFPNIYTRLPNKKRPDYLELLNYYNLEKGLNDFDILKATRGSVITDGYEFVKAFDLSKIEFDVVGTRHCSDVEKCKKYFKINKKLYLEPVNSDVIKIVFKENDKSYHLGYVPRYYSKELLKELEKNTQYSAMIESLNLKPVLSDESVILSVKLIFNN